MSARVERAPGRDDTKAGPPAEAGPSAGPPANAELSAESPGHEPTASELQRRYPSGVSVCTLPREYLAAMRDAGLWVRLVGATRRTLLRFDGEWVRYTARIDEPPERTAIPESAVLARLRRGVPVLLTPREARRQLGLATTLARGQRPDVAGDGSPDPHSPGGPDPHSPGGGRR